MADENYTDITLLIDRSGSMKSIFDETIGGLNSFVEEQKKIEGKCLISAYEFDDRLSAVIEGVPVGEIREFTTTDFVPRGWTALRDSMASVISTLGTRLALLPEAERPSKVLFVTLTDGEENASKEVSYAELKTLITHQSDKYNWDFVFLGADINVEKYQNLLGVQSAYTFEKSRIACAMNDISTGTRSYRENPSGSCFSSNVVGDSLTPTDETITRDK